MWIRSYSKVANGISKEEIWKVWSDMNNCHKWNPGVEYCRMEGKFETGGHYILKPMNMSKEVRTEFAEVEEGKKFTDLTRFPGAKMYGIHEIEETIDGVKLITTMKVEGWLKYLWIFLVAKAIVAKIPQQTDMIIECARKNK